jgi:hypothetical protein
LTDLFQLFWALFGAAVGVAVTVLVTVPAEKRRHRRQLEFTRGHWRRVRADNRRGARQELIDDLKARAGDHRRRLQIIDHTGRVNDDDGWVVQHARRCYHSDVIDELDLIAEAWVAGKTIAEHWAERTG